MGCIEPTPISNLSRVGSLQASAATPCADVHGIDESAHP